MPNQYVNKVVQSNGTTLIDISDTTALAADVASGKYFYLATGEKVEGTGEDGGGIKTLTILPEQSVTATTPDTYGYTANISVVESLIDGENYIVTLDGTTYLCYAHNKYGGADVYMGDDFNIWGDPSRAQYPFLVATWGNGVTVLGVPDTSAHTVKIEKVTGSYSGTSPTLTTKSITANGTYNASSDNADGYSSVTVNVPHVGPQFALIGQSTHTLQAYTDTSTAEIIDTQISTNVDYVFLLVVITCDGTPVSNNTWAGTAIGLVALKANHNIVTNKTLYINKGTVNSIVHSETTKPATYCASSGISLVDNVSTVKFQRKAASAVPELPAGTYTVKVYGLTAL